MTTKEPEVWKVKTHNREYFIPKADAKTHGEALRIAARIDYERYKKK